MQVFAAIRPLRDVAKSSHSDLRAMNDYWFFHIDGGHNPDEALHDLHLAASSTITQAAIVIDDPLTPVWPGVAEAIFRFLDSDQTVLRDCRGLQQDDLDDARVRTPLLRRIRQSRSTPSIPYLLSMEYEATHVHELPAADLLCSHLQIAVPQDAHHSLPPAVSISHPPAR